MPNPLAFLDTQAKEHSHALNQSIQNHDGTIGKQIRASLGIPIWSGLSIAAKLASDACRTADAVVQAVSHGQLPASNIQTLTIDLAEYSRHISGVLFGAPTALLYSPEYAADTFLMTGAETATPKLNEQESSRLYAMGDTLHKFFIDHNIDYRACSGTALGLERDQGIIRNDDDIDLMLHPDAVDAFKRLINEGIFEKETGLKIEFQKMSGGWECFYADSPKGQAGTPTENIGSPFVDIFPGVFRKKYGQTVITYGEDKMHYQSPGDYFSDEEWGRSPKLYDFGPTQLYGISDQKPYLQRCYGEHALNFTTRLYPHEVYSEGWANPQKIPTLLWRHPTPRYMKLNGASTVDYDHIDYMDRTSRDIHTIYLDGMYDIFHTGHESYIQRAIAKVRETHSDKNIRVILGVCDEGAEAYKRKPIMSLDDRVNAVKTCMQKMCDKDPALSFDVVSNAPMKISADFAKKHKINTVMHGNDFDASKQKIYYGAIQGVCHFDTVPYSDHCESTSKLIKRLRMMGMDADMKNLTGLSLETLVNTVQSRSLEELGMSQEKSAKVKM